MRKYLTEEQKRVLIHKGTEARFEGEYVDTTTKGTYSCRNCGIDLYQSDDKFHSDCGWPSFDQEIPGTVTRSIDADGRRTEITCANCKAHLGHVFIGEMMTEKNTRHCTNSISLQFTPADWKPAKAYFAGGCFWGVEYYMEQLPGVISVDSGYSGGTINDPSYREVCSGSSGHIEAVEVTYNPYKISFEELAKMFFEIHDPTQANGQGPDIGPQYISAIFYSDENEKSTSEALIATLKKNYDVVTKLFKFEKFWRAEDYHQNHYEKKRTTPYCHRYEKKF